MDDINTICYNDFGIAFQWKRCAAKDFNKIQLVFKNTGLFLSQKELIQFSKNIELALNKACSHANNTEKNPSELFLLEAPNPQVSFAMNHIELWGIQDLTKKTLFLLGLDKFLVKQKVRYS
ncbi:hypothetical protein [Flavivirga algicola]|nr:hypothetical protein [Flavivirga algicola]